MTDRRENDLFAHNYVEELIYAIEDATTRVNFERLCDRIIGSDMLLWAGNGGSGATASHMAGEYVKLVGVSSISLSDSMHAVTSYANDESYEVAFVRQFGAHVAHDNRKKTLIVYSGSGNSPNIMQLIASAIAHDVAVIAFSGYKGCKMDQLCANSEGINITSINLGLDPEYSESMQIAEDVHMIISHIILKRVCNTRREMSL